MKYIKGNIAIDADGREALHSLIRSWGYESEEAALARARKREKLAHLNTWIAENICQGCWKHRNLCTCEGG